MQAQARILRQSASFLGFAFQLPHCAATPCLTVLPSIILIPINSSVLCCCLRFSIEISFKLLSSSVQAAGQIGLAEIATL
jgi:hypothetical protein